MPMAREGLRLQLETFKNIEIIGEATNADDALKMILELKPQIVFLDINLPQKNGFDLLDRLKEQPKMDLEIVFVTGHPEHAVKAYDYFPFQFLLKPVASHKLNEVIERFTDSKIRKDFKDRVDEFKTFKNKLHFKGEDGYTWIKPEDILWCKADRNYSEIYLKQGNIVVVSENLSKIESMLHSNSFYRSHRSYIVNYKNVQKINTRNGKITLNVNPFTDSPIVAKENIKELIYLINKDI